MPESSTCYDPISLSYDPYMAIYAIIPLREDCPQVTDKVRNDALRRAIDHVIKDGRVWCNNGTCADGMCLPRVQLDTRPRFGTTSSQPMDNGTHKRCYLEVFIEAEITCECGERVEWFDIPEE